MNLKTQLLACLLGVAVAGSAAAQFINVGDGPSARSTHSEPIPEPYDRAGGGVILRGVASCADDKTTCEILSAGISSNGGGRSQLRVVTSRCEARYSAPGWMLKDAVKLVAGETDTIYRNVNLLGKPGEEEESVLTSMFFFHVEVSPELIETRTGETLLVVDAMLTNPSRYANFRVGLPTVKNPNDVMESETAGVKSFNAAYEKFKAEIVNWTWNDRNRAFSFVVSCDQNTLNLYGSPIYTFLTRDKKPAERPTEYFAENPNLIHGLNPEVYSSAIQFAQIAAFLRRIHHDQPAVWKSLVKDAAAIPASRGTTPRLIPRF